MPGLSPSFKPDPEAKRKFRAITEGLAAALSPSDPNGVAKLLRESAARFVRNVADITPPATGTADAAAKKRGENAIISDLIKLAVPLQGAGTNSRAARETLNTAEDLLALHARSQVKGRVNPRNRKEKLFLPQAAFNRAAKVLLDRVGWLAAGLNAAAEKLGRPLPLWIRRHGSKHGKIDVTVGRTGIRITVTQNVPYADGVSGYNRRWQFALDREIRALHRQAEIVLRARLGKVTHLKDL